MTTSRHDLRHGRQGGRIVDFPGVAPDICDQCGQPSYGGPRHRGCQPQLDVDPWSQLALFEQP